MVKKIKNLETIVGYHSLNSSLSLSLSIYIYICVCEREREREIRCIYVLVIWWCCMFWLEGVNQVFITFRVNYKLHPKSLGVFQF